MKTTLKRVLSMALALVLLVGVLPMAALAAETVSTITSVPTFTAHDSAENVVQFVCDDTTHGFKCSSTTCSYEQHKCTENHFDNDCDGKCDFKLTVGAGNDEKTYTCGKQFKEAGHTAGSIGATCTYPSACCSSFYSKYRS